jgi:hypothetical protein
MHEASERAVGGRRWIWPILAGLLVIAVILGMTFWRHRAPEASQVAAPTADSSPRSTAAQHRSAGSRPAPPGRPFSMAEHRARRKAMQAEQVRRGRAFHAALAARYAAEPVDAAWAGAKEAKLLGASVSDEIRRADAVPRNYSATCRSTICRIGADFQNRGAIQDWLTLFSTGTGGELPNEAYVVSQNPDGSLHLEIMGLARK